MKAIAAVAALTVSVLIAGEVQAASSETEVRRMRAQSEALARSYLQGWSHRGNGAISSLPRMYGERVAFYGRFVTRPELAAEKQRFTRRWPIRRYAMRPGTVKTDCSAALRACRLRSIIDWEVRSPARGKAARGSARFALGIDFGSGRPVVRGENGLVLQRR